MKEQQKRKIQQFHPEIEDGTDLRRWPHMLRNLILMILLFYRTFLASLEDKKCVKFYLSM